jgi:hypothetical protein
VRKSAVYLRTAVAFINRSRNVPQLGRKNLPAEHSFAYTEFLLAYPARVPARTTVFATEQIHCE